METFAWLKKRKIAVLYGGPSPEAAVSRRTGKAVLNGFKNLGLRAVGIEAGADLAKRIKDSGAGFCFIAMHGKPGEDGTVQGLLDVMGIPYAGSGVLSSAMSMDKAATKIVFQHHKIPTAPFQILEPVGASLGSGLSAGAIKLRPPYVVKPVDGGSAIGVSVVRNASGAAAALRAARRVSRRVLAEKFIDGIEVTVPVLGDQVLPVIEIVPKGKFYDYKSKYVKGMSSHVIPARITAQADRACRRFALEAHRALGCRGFSRTDFIIDKKNQPWALELNSIPGMTETSLFPESAKAAGYSFESMLLEMVRSSL